MSTEDADPTWGAAAAAASPSPAPPPAPPLAHPCLRVSVAQFGNKPALRHEADWFAALPRPRTPPGPFVSVSEKILGIIPESVLELGIAQFNKWMRFYGVGGWLLDSEMRVLGTIRRNRLAQQRRGALFPAAPVGSAVTGGLPGTPKKSMGKGKHPKKAKPEIPFEGWLAKLPGPGPAEGAFQSIEDKLSSIFPDEVLELERVHYNQWMAYYGVRSWLTKVETTELSGLRRRRLVRKYARVRRAREKSWAKEKALRQALGPEIARLWTARRHRDYPRSCRDVISTMHLCNARAGYFGAGSGPWHLPRLPNELVWMILEMLTGRDLAGTIISQLERSNLVRNPTKFLSRPERLDRAVTIPYCRRATPCIPQQFVLNQSQKHAAFSPMNFWADVARNSQARLPPAPLSANPTTGRGCFNAPHRQQSIFSNRATVFIDRSPFGFRQRQRFSPGKGTTPFKSTAAAMAMTPPEASSTSRFEEIP